MLIEESIRRQNELRNCLYEMASTCMDETEIRSISIKLKALYTDGFRHNYLPDYNIEDCMKQGNVLKDMREEEWDEPLLRRSSSGNG